MREAMGAANNISLPEPLLAEIQIAAQAEHRTVDEVLTDQLTRLKTFLETGKPQ